MKSPLPKKNNPPKLYTVTAGMRYLGLFADSSNKKVPKKQQSAPKQANRSTQNPLSSSSISSVTVFPGCLSPRHNFHVCAKMITAEPIMKSRLPSHARSRTGMKQADPTKQSSDPVAEMKKFIDNCRKGHREAVQCSHSVMSAKRKVKEPIVQSQAETSAASMCYPAKGNRAKEPRRKVQPPMKQLRLCQMRQLRLLSTVDFTCIYITYHTYQIIHIYIAQNVQNFSGLLLIDSGSTASVMMFSLKASHYSWCFSCYLQYFSFFQRLSHTLGDHPNNFKAFFGMDMTSQGDSAMMLKVRHYDRLYFGKKSPEEYVATTSSCPSPFNDICNCLRTVPFKRQQIAFGISPYLIKKVPKGKRCSVKNCPASLKVYQEILSSKILAFFTVFIISQRYCMTLMVNLPTSRFGTTATKVSSKVNGKNFCFQLQALPKQFPSERKTTSYWSSISCCLLQSPTFPLRTRYRHSASYCFWQTKAFSLNLARNMARQM